MKLVKSLFLVLTFTLLPLFTVGSTAALSGSSFRTDRIIDDHIFFDSNSLGAPDIQSFLDSKVPNCDTNGVSSIYDSSYGDTVTRAVYSSRRGNSTPFHCLRFYSQEVPNRPADQYCGGSIAGGVKTAAQIIKEVSVACSISPKVMLVLLQKEQSLVTDNWPWLTQYTKATGFGCPDTTLPTNVDSNSNGCYDEYEGFFNQIYYGARQYQKYAKSPDSFSYKAGRNNYIQYNPNSGCGGTNVFIQNVATAGLYNYTPYQPNTAALNNLYGTGDGCSAYGNRNFWRLYSQWFGSPVSGVYYNGNTLSKTDVQLQKSTAGIDSPTFLILAGSGSGCVEAHTWNGGFTSWKNHIASNQPGITTPDAKVLYGNLDGDKRDYPVLLGITSTGSGMIESHVWERSMGSYLVHAASNRAVVSPADNEIIFADLNGDKKEEPILVSYRNTGSGMIEFHGWSEGTKSWMYHIATNMPAVDPLNNRVVFGDLDGDKSVEAILVSLDVTGSNRIEFHVWAAGQASWASHIASNMPTVNPLNAKVEFGDFDGNGTDEAMLIGLRGTGSGMIEFHVWNPGFTSWRSNTASNQSSPAN